MRAPKRAARGNAARAPGETREDVPVSVGGSIVEVMDGAEHWTAWLHRYRDAKANLATLIDVFARREDHDKQSRQAVTAPQLLLC